MPRQGGDSPVHPAPCPTPPRGALPNQGPSLPARSLEAAPAATRLGAYCPRAPARLVLRGCGGASRHLLLGEEGGMGAGERCWGEECKA